MSRIYNLFATVILVCVLLVNVSQTKAITWNNSINDNWSTGGNWSGGLAPISTDTVTFTNVGVGETTIMDLGASSTVATYEIYPNTANATHTLNLGSNTLNVGIMKLAVSSADGFHYGHLAVQGTAGSALNVTDTLEIGTGRKKVANMTLSPDVQLNIGVNPTTRGNLILTDNSSGSHALAVSSLTPGNSFNAYLTNLTVGREVSNGDPNDSVATLNLTNTSGVLDISGAVLVGEGFAASGIVNIGDDVDTKIGVNPSSRGSLRIASGDAKRPIHTPSTMTVGTGSFEAYLSELSVAHATRMSNWLNVNNVSATGTLDLTSVTNGFIDVDGITRVGTVRSGFGFALHPTSPGTLVPVANDPDFSPSSHGNLLLGAMHVTTTDLIVGDMENYARNEGVVGDIGQGIMELYGTQFSVTGDVTIDGYDVAHGGQVNIEVEGESSGLLLSNASTLTIGNGNIDITFLTPDPEFGGDYFGLRWQGDHTAELLALGSKLTWDDTALTDIGRDPVSIYFSDGFTYVGTYIPPVPEPGTGLLMALGLCALLRRRNKQRA